MDAIDINLREIMRHKTFDENVMETAIRLAEGRGLQRQGKAVVAVYLARKNLVEVRAYS